MQVIYLKELTDIEEIFSKDSKIPFFIKKIILYLKKVFFVVTMLQDGVCILPYKKITSFSKIKLYFLKKILKKIQLPIVLSKQLEKVEPLRYMLEEIKMKQIEGKELSNYLLIEIIEYLCKMMKEEKQKQGITLLIQTKTPKIEKQIIELAKHVRSIQIVTPKILHFQRLENVLEENFGMACQITNNKKRSLVKSKIIINLNFSEELLNQFILNPEAIIIDINQKTKIYSKSFLGVHIYDYQITSDNQVMKSDVFEMKKMYEAKLIGNNYEQARDELKNDYVKVVNLIGRKGIIHQAEYTRISKEKALP